MKTPLIYSLASGLAWIGVASVIAYLVSPVFATPSDVAKTFAGGIVAAPGIGVLIGYISRRFANLSGPRRVWVALRDLYLATFLFLFATGIGPVARDLVWHSHYTTLQRSLVVGPVLGTLLGLTYTGFVIVLLPLSYVNHVLIGRAWAHAD